MEKDAEVRKRTYIENKMTEALLRTCWKCKTPFLKSDGCNKMTCSCGAKMCYLCRKPVTDYSHFFGQGGEKTSKATCPLWSDNQTLHETDVAKGAFEAKAEIEEQEPDVVLKHDPTKDLKKPNEAKDDTPKSLADILGRDEVGLRNRERQRQRRVRWRRRGINPRPHYM